MTLEEAAAKVRELFDELEAEGFTFGSWQMDLELCRVGLPLGVGIRCP